MIPEQIRNALHSAELVVADLTERNPNVMYEIGVRHALGLPLLMISRDLRGLPFDVSHYRTISYDPADIESVSECKRRLTDYIRNIVPAQPTVSAAHPSENFGRAIIADGQKQMLMNPYPYQREAYNSWCVVAMDTFGGVYSSFKQAHFDEPWDNAQLAVPYDEACRQQLAQKLEADAALAREQILGQLSMKDATKAAGAGQ